MSATVHLTRCYSSQRVPKLLTGWIGRRHMTYYNWAQRSQVTECKVRLPYKFMFYLSRSIFQSHLNAGREVFSSRSRMATRLYLYSSPLSWYDAAIITWIPGFDSSVLNNSDTSVLAAVVYIERHCFYSPCVCELIKFKD